MNTSTYRAALASSSRIAPSTAPTSWIEPLEPRIAPAVLVVNAHTATYTDVDGDHVTIHVSKGDLSTAAFTTAAVGVGEQLELIDLSAGGFEGANLSISVSKVNTGDGLANVGAINASGQNLGKVSVAGDLGQIDVGTNNISVKALKSLSVGSIGIYGLATQGGAGDLTSDINGSLGSLKVLTDLDGAINVIGGLTSKIGSAFIGGSLIGGSASTSGALVSSGDIGPVQIGGDVVGGEGATSGFIQSSGQLASVTIGGSLIGGSGSISGQIGGSAGIGTVKIGHDIQGGTGVISGGIGSGGKLTSVSVGGSVFGGSNTDTGSIGAGGDIGSISIGGNLLGGLGDNSGHIQANGNVDSIRIGGSLVGGSNAFSGQIQLNGNTGSVVIGGDVKGDTGTLSGQIQANGTLKLLQIGGSVIGGSGSFTGELQINVSAGVVKIGHDLRGGSGNDSGVIAGQGNINKLSLGGSLVGGTANSTGAVLAGDIGSVTVGGSLLGGSITMANSLDTTGEIVGKHIGSAFIGGSIVSGSDNSTGSLTNNAGIRASEDIGSLVVGGSVIGNTSSSGNSPVIISAQGEANPTATHDSAIGSIAIGGQVEHALILGGYSTGVDAANTSLAFANSNAQIGSVKIGGDWIASSLVAGAVDVNNDGFGNADDATAGTGMLSKIASIIIKGNVAGTAAAFDHFGFESGKIGAFTYAGYTAPLTSAGGEVFELSPITGDVTVREV